MPLYFFHVTDGDEFCPDPEGVERADHAAAEKEALDAVSGLIADAVKRGERNYQGQLDVRDEHGERVLALTFSCPIYIEVITSMVGDQ